MRLDPGSDEVHARAVVGVRCGERDGRRRAVDLFVPERIRARPVEVPAHADDGPGLRMHLGVHFELYRLADGDLGPNPAVGADPGDRLDAAALLDRRWQG